MAKEKLNAKKLTSLKSGVNADGKPIDFEHSDGGGLYLVATAGGNHRWLFKFQWEGKTRRMGLGSLDLVSADQARELAREARKRAHYGINPMVERPGEELERGNSPTFKTFVAEIRPVVASGISEISIKRWDLGMNVYAKPLHDLKIATITRQQVVNCLRPIWLDIPVAAKKFQTQLHDLFVRAIAADKLPATAPNPADWTFLKKLLDQQPDQEGGHRSLPYTALPAVWPRLVDIDSMASLAAQWIILTGVRTGEARQARKDQVDLEAGIWHIPGKVMKNGKPADVTLSRQAIAVARKALALQASVRLETPLLFPGKRASEMLNQNTVLFLFQNQLELDATTHGFRSSFRSWGGDQKGIERDVLEHCLHHLLGDAAEMAYNKAEQREKRQEVMQAWADYVTGVTPPAIRRRPDLKVVAA
jgi:integrase